MTRAFGTQGEQNTEKLDRAVTHAWLGTQCSRVTYRGGSDSYTRAKIKRNPTPFEELSLAHACGVSYQGFRTKVR